MCPFYMLLTFLMPSAIVRLVHLPEPVDAIVIELLLMLKIYNNG